uniref:Uncharacterized protein n=1 Tax=Arion vulgaris TaxID=1028688 RepID=A0A0B7BJL2_9EUPU
MLLNHCQLVPVEPLFTEQVLQQEESKLSVQTLLISLTITLSILLSLNQIYTAPKTIQMID